jgi:hypothetical protein
MTSLQDFKYSNNTLHTWTYWEYGRTAPLESLR